MLSAIRSRITYVNVVATLVLVFAMTGGALAAKKYLITSTKQISPSVLKSLQGKSGAAGLVGVAGAIGAQGPAGPAGPAGGKGETGAPGKEGQGKEGPQGKQGVTGAKGANGSPWTAGGTLPPKATETGVWGTGALEEPEGEKSFQISFPIPLASAPETVIVASNEEEKAGCKGRGGGGFPATGTYKPTVPEADPGKLCIYVDAVDNAEVGEIWSPEYLAGEGWAANVGATPAGGVLDVDCTARCAVMGTWAVTGPEE